MVKKPINCPLCRHNLLYRHTPVSTKYHGVIERFKCVRCNAIAKVYEDEIMRALAEEGVEAHLVDLTTVAGLVALGLPLEQIGRLVGRKAETVKRHLIACVGVDVLRTSVTNSLKCDHHFDREEMARFTQFPASKDRTSPYWLAFATRTSILSATKDLIDRREQLSRRIANLVGGPVAFTGAGEFWLTDADAAKIPWIRTIRRAPKNVVESPLFSDLQRLVWERVRSPGNERKATARPGGVPGETLISLSSGVGKVMDLGVFVETLKEIVTAIKKGWT